MRNFSWILLAAVSLGLSAAAQQDAAPKTIANVLAPIALPAAVVPAAPSAQPVAAPEPMAPLAPGISAIVANPAPPPEIQETHRFMDRKNLIIFSALATARMMDPISTWHFRSMGLHEGQLSDSFVDNKPLFVAYSSSLVAGQIATSYLFHRLGWHKAERISALVHTGVVSEAVIHNYRLH
jgi:hypothetical protein